MVEPFNLMSGRGVESLEEHAERGKSEVSPTSAAAFPAVKREDFEENKMEDVNEDEVKEAVEGKTTNAPDGSMGQPPHSIKIVSFGGGDATAATPDLCDQYSRVSKVSAGGAFSSKESSGEELRDGVGGYGNPNTATIEIDETCAVEKPIGVAQGVNDDRLVSSVSGGSNREAHAVKRDGEEGQMDLEDVQSDASPMSFDFCTDSDEEDDEVVFVEKRKISAGLDVESLRESIEQSAPVLKEVLGKDLVVVVGDTGSGKSTLIQTLSGKKLFATTHITKKFNKVVSKLVFEAKDPVQGFEIGHAKASKTRHVNLCKVSFMKGNGKACERILLDTPGIGDTAGPEHDIATAVMLAQVAKRCRRLSFVILINYVSLLEKRGGAVWSALKMIRSFVQDFQESRESFMFLFTHIDEIRGITAENLDLARKSLHDEIIQIADGQGDGDGGVNKVLKFMRLSLERGFPFCDVFHPLHSDAKRLLINISMLKWTSGTNLSLECGSLTPAARMRLQGELEKLNLQLHRILVNKQTEMQPDLDKAKFIHRSFLTFEEYINIDQVRDAAVAAQRVFQSYILRMQSLVVDVVKRGTEQCHAFGQADITNLKRALENLHELSGCFQKEIDIDGLKGFVEKKVVNFQKMIINQLSTSVEGLPGMLNALQTWSRGLSQLESLYSEAVQHLEAAISVAVCGIEEFHKAVTMENASSQQLTDQLERIAFLQDVNLHANDITTHVDLCKAMNLLGVTKKDHQSVLTAWGNEFDTQLQRVFRTELESDLTRILMRARVVEILYSQLEKRSICPVLEETTRTVRSRLSSIAATRMVDACDHFVSQIPSIDPREVKERLEFLSKVEATYQRVGNVQWQDALTPYSLLIDALKSFLKTRSGELEEIVNSVHSRGVVDGRRDSVFLEKFGLYCFFDSYVQDGEQFVENCFVAYSRVYKDRIKFLSENVAKSLEEAQRGGKRAVEKLILVKATFSELKQMSFVAPVLSNSSGLDDSNPTNRITQFAEQLVRTTTEEVRDWEQVIRSPAVSCRDKVCSLTERLGLALEEVNILIEIRFGSDIELNECRKLILEAGAKFSSDTREILMRDAYPAKADILFVLAEIHETSNGPFYCTLPDYVEVREEVRRCVSAHAKKIEDQISETSDWDEIDSLILNLEAATILDPYIDGEASSRLRPLRKLREKREGQVDDQLEKMIVEHNYEGLTEFLAPLARSRDQLKKQKFHRCLDKILSSLSEVLGNVRSHLRMVNPDGNQLRVVASGLKTLKKANKELGTHLNAKASSIHLNDEVKEIEGTINKKFNLVLDHLSKAASLADFVSMGKRKAQVLQFKSNLSDFLSSQSKRKQKAALDAYRKAVGSVSSELDSFFDSSFSDDRILPILSSLKDAIEINNSEFITLYEEITTKLTERLRGVLMETRDFVSVHHCYDDAIALLGVLDRQLRKGLEDFVRSSVLVTEVREQHKTWCDERLKNEEELFGRKISLDIVLGWRTELDRLNPSVLGAKVRAWVLGRSYEKLQRRIASLVEDRLATGLMALRHRDYELLQDCLRVLVLVRKHLRKHVISIVEAVDKLSGESRRNFKQLCEKAKSILLAPHSRRQFLEVFESYRRMVIAVPSVTSSEESERMYRLINQLTYEALEGDINRLDDWATSLDFPELKRQVEGLRVFGGYLADYATLFHEEVRCSEHLGEDTWLSKIFQLCQEHFSVGRSFGHIHQCALLQTPPSATKREVKKAFHTLAVKHHPDKQGSCVDAGDMFRKIKEAYEELEEVAPSETTRERPFDDFLRGVQDTLRNHTRRYLADQRYGKVEKILYQLADLHVLDKLVEPSLNSREVKEMMMKTIKAHVDKIRIEVNSNWNERKYSELNDNLVDLKLMEDKFKSFSDIFPNAWKKQIFEAVEYEIVSLGKKASLLLVDRTTAQASMQEFRRYFIKMGCVLVELAQFREHTRDVMIDVLEECLGSDWGYSYLFDFGLSLQKGSEHSSEEENMVAQFILSEFSHFKEVLTMVWNEETSQKPVEDTVTDICGHKLIGVTKQQLTLDTELLLTSFREFEAEYKSLLGEYIVPEADLEKLTRKVIDTANGLKPISCAKGWGGSAKQQIPMIMAGVFALFTIQKSGSSYNRIDPSDKGADLRGKLLMKPHNIQVLTLLCMFGCGSVSTELLENQLMQIRTGEGKSMILGAAAAVLGLLGFRVRCVCYSDYLSTRDYNLFREVFDLFHLTKVIKYSKITTLSEDTTARKGDVRELTIELLRGSLHSHHLARNHRKRASERAVESGGEISDNRGSEGDPIRSERSQHESSHSIEECSQEDRERPDHNRRGWLKNMLGSLSLYSSHNGTDDKNEEDGKEEILLVDEVDVFFGSEFYGKTYNQVAMVREPEVKNIIQQIWDSNKRGGRKLRLIDIQQTDAYKQLLKKLEGFKFLIDNEISAMLSQVRLVDEEPYYFNKESGQIGYKRLDGISYEVTFGYRTTFAYMREAENGNLRNEEILKGVMALQVSCGQFSYANISPSRILGVSGTLDAMGEYEKKVLAKYGVSTFLFVPSVYGQSNFSFDRGGDGINLESTKSDYFHSITNEILQATKEKKRAVIVFFKDKKRMDEYIASPFFPKLGRQKKVLQETMSASERDFVISKAATAGQITISTAVFGRGTDFFCKDERVQENGGVHVIQGFLSKERSEEIQIQGRTARQGKKGTYQLILLDSDLHDDFRVDVSSINNIAKDQVYQFLCRARDEQHKRSCQETESSLAEATRSDLDTHTYFDSLLAGDTAAGRKNFRKLYESFKKKQMPSNLSIDLAFLIDITGSMVPYVKAVTDTLTSVIEGSNSIVQKLKGKFPDIEFKIRIATLGYRDIDDGKLQFDESICANHGHFSDDPREAINFIINTVHAPSGGADIAEDHLGAINRCASWQAPNDWSSDIKFMILFTDAPGHGTVDQTAVGHSNADRYPTRHPRGLHFEGVIGQCLNRDIDLFFCSFNPSATRKTEDLFAQHYLGHPQNVRHDEITVIPMIQEEKRALVGITETTKSTTQSGGNQRHMVFVLDESGSMGGFWSGVVKAYNDYVHRRRQSQCDTDLVSVVQFDNTARTTVSLQPISSSPTSLGYRGGGTQFGPAANTASSLVAQTPSTHVPVVVFMSDGCAGDASAAANAFSSANQSIRRRYNNSNLELHVIGFGGGTDTTQLQQIANSTGNGKVYSSANAFQLSNIFMNIAGGQEVAKVLEAEVGKRISEAVADRLAAEYLG